MNLVRFLPLLTLVFAVDAAAQGRIWRCGNTYTNDESQGRHCKLVEGGNLTIVQGTRVNNANAITNTSTAAPAAKDNAKDNAKDMKVAAAPAVLSSPPTAPRIDAGEQRARDADARAILEAELKKAEARQAELAKEWNNGEPEKLGPEHRNHQKYIDRVAELKASIARNENDIAGLKRELGRTAPAAAAAAR